MSKHHCTSSLAALIAVSAFLGRAQASAEEEATPQVGGIETITVTARKTEEDLQKTPVAVTAFTGEDLKDRGINRVIDLSATAPNVIFKSLGGYANGTTVSIRGLGANPDGRPFVDPGVSIYVDGVVQPRPSHNLLDLVDIDRIEVLRGPQGTLFGRNTVGGAVNIITRLPSEEFGIEQKFSFGTHSDIESRSTINTGQLFESNFTAKLIYDHHQNAGYQRSTLAPPGTPSGGYSNSDSGLLVVHGDLSPDLTVDLKGYYTARQDMPPASAIVAWGPSNSLTYFSDSPRWGGKPVMVYGPDYVDTVNDEQRATATWPSTYAGGSATVSWRANDALTLKSITGVTLGRSVNHTDCSGGNGGLLGPVLVGSTITIQNVAPYTCNVNGETGLDLSGDNAPIVDGQVGGPIQTERDQSFSEELNAVGGWDDLQYAVGLFYLDEHVKDYNPTAFTSVIPYAVTPQTPLGLVGVQGMLYSFWRIYNQTAAGYAQASWKPEVFDEKLEITGGLRYSYEHKRMHEKTFFNGFNTLNRVPTKTWHYINFNTSLRYQWTEDFGTYFRVANADQAGGFNPQDANTVYYDPEVALLYEGGFRSEFFDHRVRLNGTGFYTKFTNEQVQVFVPPVSSILNAGKSHQSGAELEMQAAPTDDILIDGSLGYLHAEYDVYPFNGNNIASIAHETQSPKLTAHIGAQYTWAQDWYGVPRFRIDYSFRDAYFKDHVDALQAFPTLGKAKPFNKLDIRLSFSDFKLGSGVGRFEVYGQNILDQHPFYGATDFGPGRFNFMWQVLGPGATYGAALTIDLD